MTNETENRPVFKVGQRVRCMDAEASFNRLGEDCIYTVSGYDNGAVYLHGIGPNHSAERFVSAE